MVAVWSGGQWSEPSNEPVSPRWVASVGIATGYASGDGTARCEPDAPALREQMAAFLSRFDRYLQGG